MPYQPDNKANNEFRRLLVERAVDAQSQSEYQRGRRDAYDDCLREFEARTTPPPTPTDYDKADADEAAG